MKHWNGLICYKCFYTILFQVTGVRRDNFANLVVKDFFKWIIHEATYSKGLFRRKTCETKIPSYRLDHNFSNFQ